MEDPNSGNFRIVNARIINDEVASHVVTRSKGKYLEPKKKEEGSRDNALEAPSPTEEVFMEVFTRVTSTPRTTRTVLMSEEDTRCF